jgi:hypothetical protein
VRPNDDFVWLLLKMDFRRCADVQRSPSFERKSIGQILVDRVLQHHDRVIDLGLRKTGGLAHLAHADMRPSSCVSRSTSRIFLIDILIPAIDYPCCS